MGVPRIKVWLYGMPFSGKTRMASTFPTPLVLSTDGNAEYYDVDVKRIKNIEDFSKAIDEFLKDTKHETLVIDVLEHVFDMQRDYVLDKSGFDHEQDANDFGKTHAKVRKGFWTIVREVSTIDDKNIVIISHEEQHTEKDRLGREVTSFTPKLEDTKEGFHNKISGIMGFVMRCYTEKDKDGHISYKVSCGSQDTELSGARLQLKNRVFGNSYDELVKEIVWNQKS